MRKRSELVFNLLLVPLDAFLLLGSWVVAFLIRVQYSDLPTVYQIPGHVYLAAFIALAPVSIIVFALAGLYNFDSTRSRWREYSRVLIATSASTMTLIIIDFFTTEPLFPSKAVVIYGYVLASLSIIIARFLLNGFQRWLFRYNIGRRQVVIVGKGTAADGLTYALQQHNGYHVVATIDEIAPGLKHLQRILKRHHVDEIFLAQADVPSSRHIELIQLTHAYHITYKFVPTLAGIYQTRTHSELLGDLPVIEIVRTPLDGWWRIYKSLFDYLFAILGVIILSPLFVVVAILVKFTDGGKVFYRHERVGRDSRTIRVWKFRTMYAKYSTGAGYTNKSDAEILSAIGDDKLAEEFAKEQKLKKDPRVTPIGRWLRKTSIDELPQLFNVLRNELSLIGPRPVTKDELGRYGDAAPTFLLIKPGLTGLWQVSGRNDISYAERVKLDLYYVENWNALQDLRILVRTVGVLFFGKGY